MSALCVFWMTSVQLTIPVKMEEYALYSHLLIAIHVTVLVQNMMELIAQVHMTNTID